MIGAALVACGGSDGGTSSNEPTAITTPFSTGETGTVVDTRVRPLQGVTWRDRPGQDAGFWLSVADIDGDGTDETFIGLPRGSYRSGTAPPWSGAARVDGVPESGYIEVVAGATWRAASVLDDYPQGGVVGDVTADGVMDLSLIRHKGDPVESGYELRVFSASANGMIDEDAWTARIDGEGGTAPPCGDLDGDGVDDLWVGRSAYQGPIVGELTQDAADLVFEFTPVGDKLPELYRAADLDSSGRPDLILTHPYDAAHVIGFLDPPWGVHSMDAGDVAWTLEAAKPGNDRGTRAMTVGDMDDDGSQELVVDAWSSEEYQVYVAPGTGGELALAPTRLAGIGFGDDLVADDLDGDGVADLALGASPLGEWPTVWVLRGPLQEGVLTVDDVDVIWTIRPAFGTEVTLASLASGNIDGAAGGELIAALRHTEEGGNAIVVLPGGGL